VKTRSRRAKLKGRGSGSPGSEAHVRLYRHELECAAYRTLSPAARALLVELRSLFSPAAGDNKVFLGMRRTMERCNLTQRAAARARDELVEKGWVKIVQLGGFSCKVRHSTVFALENEVPNTGNGSQPGKAFMRWQPPAESTKNHGMQIDYRPVCKSTTDTKRKRQKRAATVCENATDMTIFSASSVVVSTTQIALPSIGRSSAVDLDPDPAPAPGSPKIGQPHELA